MNSYTTEPLRHIVNALQKQLRHCDAHSIISFEVFNPDFSDVSYSGKMLILDGASYLYRGYKTWTDLAQLLFCRMLTPIPSGKHTVILRFKKLNLDDSFHKIHVKEITEKYGVNSTFFSLNKNEEASFLLAYLKALDAVKISQRHHVLNLGINGGDEFQIIKETLSLEQFSNIHFTGVDYSASAITFAQKRFSESNVTMIEHDINQLNALELERSDLIISIGTLQSPGVDFKPLFMSLIQNYLTSDGALILGFPNCRWIDGEMIYGAKAPNYSYSEMSLVIKDIYFCKKYLQQHRFRVTLTGKDYIFLTATRIGNKESE